MGHLPNDVHLCQIKLNYCDGRNLGIRVIEDSGSESDFFSDLQGKYPHKKIDQDK